MVLDDILAVGRARGQAINETRSFRDLSRSLEQSLEQLLDHFKTPIVSSTKRGAITRPVS